MKRILPCCLLAAVLPSIQAQEPPLRAQLENATKAEDKASSLELRRRLLASGGADASALRDLVAGMIEAGDVKRAATLLESAGKAAKLPPGAEDELRGDLAAADGRDSEALAAWERALNARPAGRIAIIGNKLADVARRSGLSEPAVRALRKVAGAVPGADGAKLRMQLALAELRQGDFEDAVRDGQAASKQSASEAFVKASYPTIEALQKGLPQLGAAVAKAKANPDAFAGQMELGGLYAANGALSAAQRAAESAQKSFPEAKSALLLRAHCLRAAGQPDEAAKLGVAAIPDGPRFVARLLPALTATDVTLRAGPEANALARRSANLLAAGQPHLAIEAAEAALKLDPKSGIGALIAGQASSQLGRRAEAVRYARLATENAPRDAEAWNFSAQLQRRRTDYRGAVDSFTQALALTPRDVDSLKGREACLRTLGRDAEADRDREAWVQLTTPKPASTPPSPKRG